MKQLLLTLFLGVSSICYSQDTLQIPSVELEEFFLALDTLKVQDSLKASLIVDLERTIKLYEQLSQQDSLIIKFKDEEIQKLLFKHRPIVHTLKGSTEERINQIIKTI